MCGAFELDPPLEVEVGVGDDWLAAKSSRPPAACPLRRGACYTPRSFGPLRSAGRFPPVNDGRYS